MIKFFYFRKPARGDEKRGQPVACVAYQETYDDINGHLLSFGASVWCPRDRFNKEHGRSLAAGRLATMPIVIMRSYIGKDPAYSPIYDIASFLRNHHEWGGHIPTRLVRAVNSWLQETA